MIKSLRLTILSREETHYKNTSTAFKRTIISLHLYGYLSNNLTFLELIFRDNSNEKVSAMKVIEDVSANFWKEFHFAKFSSENIKSGV